MSGSSIKRNPAQLARLDEVGVQRTDQVAVDAFGRDALAAAALDFVVECPDNWTMRSKGCVQYPGQHTTISLETLSGVAQYTMDVDDVPVARRARDTQDVRLGAVKRDEDRANQRKLNVAPGVVDEQRYERQDDADEAGRQQ